MSKHRYQLLETKTLKRMTDKLEFVFVEVAKFDKSEDELCGEFDFMGMTLSRTFYESVPKFDIYEHISAFDNPVLVMHGDSDGLVDISYAEKVKNELADCRLTVYHGEGHGFSPKARR